MFHRQYPIRVMTPIGKDDPEVRLAELTGRPAVIGCKPKIKFESGDLVASGSVAPVWAGTDINIDGLYKIPLPCKAKRVTVANSHTFCVLLENGETYAYGEPTSLDSSYSRYVLNDPTPVTDFSIPKKFNLGNWADVSMGSFWSFHQPTGPYAKLQTLADTSQHFSLLKEELRVYWGCHEYINSGNGMHIVSMNSDGTVRYDTSVYLESSGIIRSGVLELVTAYYGKVFASDGIYDLTRDSSKGVYLSKLDFPYGQIKCAWPTSHRTVLVQNTENKVYLYEDQSSPTTGQWKEIGEVDIAKLSSFGQGAVSYVITPTSELNCYWSSSPTGGFIRICSPYLFSDVASVGKKYMAIIK